MSQPLVHFSRETEVLKARHGRSATAYFLLPSSPACTECAPRTPETNAEVILRTWKTVTDRMSSLSQLKGCNFVKNDSPEHKTANACSNSRKEKQTAQVSGGGVHRQSLPPRTGSPTRAVLVPEPIWHQTFRLQQPDTRSHFDLTAEEGFISSWTVWCLVSLLMSC